MKLTKDHARKVLKVVDAGLTSGLGSPVPGQMCVEAAVSYALGLPHDDTPVCVGEEVRMFKIGLNDKSWSSDKARARGLRRVAIAQLGSNKINQRTFNKELKKEIGKAMFLPALRQAADETDSKKADADLRKEIKKLEAGNTNINAYAPDDINGEFYLQEALDNFESDQFEDAVAELGVYLEWSNDKALTEGAECAVRVLQRLKCEGTKWLHLCKAV